MSNEHDHQRMADDGCPHHEDAPAPAVLDALGELAEFAGIARNRVAMRPLSALELYRTLFQECNIEGEPEWDDTVRAYCERVIASLAAGRFIVPAQPLE